MSDNTFAIHGLTRERGELAGQMLILQEQVRQLTVDAALVRLLSGVQKQYAGCDV